VYRGTASEGRYRICRWLFLIDSLVALLAFDDRISGRRDRVGKSRLSASRRPLDDDRLLHARSEVDHLKRNRIDHVLRRFQTKPQIIDR
jgi:hypothetical protein